MPLSLSEEQIERIARRRVGARLGWYGHAAVYVLVNLLILLVSEHGLGTRPWSAFPLLGWGMGLALHGVAVFVLGSGGGLRERLVDQERDRIRREQGRAPRP